MLILNFCIIPQFLFSLRSVPDSSGPWLTPVLVIFHLYPNIHFPPFFTTFYRKRLSCMDTSAGFHHSRLCLGWTMKNLDRTSEERKRMRSGYLLSWIFPLEIITGWDLDHRSLLLSRWPSLTTLFIWVAGTFPFLSYPSSFCRSSFCLLASGCCSKPMVLVYSENEFPIVLL